MTSNLDCLYNTADTIGCANDFAILKYPVELVFWTDSLGKRACVIVNESVKGAACFDEFGKSKRNNYPEECKINDVRL